MSRSRHTEAQMIGALIQSRNRTFTESQPFLLGNGGQNTDHSVFEQPT